jgi:hypothetical protein
MAAAIAESLTADERQVLAWLAEHVPQREIAAWCGVTYGAMRVRVTRLREKARAVARRWIATCPPDERASLTRLLEHAARPPLPPRAPTRGRTRRGAGAASPGEPDDAAP